MKEYLENKEKYLQMIIELNRKNRKKKDIGLGIKKILLYPAFDNVDDLKEVLEKLTFALPAERWISVLVPVKKDVLKVVEKNYEVNKCKHIKFISNDIIEKNLDNSILLIHKIDDNLDTEIITSALDIKIIDKFFYSYMEAETLRNLYFNTLEIDIRKRYLEISRNNFKKFYENNIYKKEAYCFTSGPSFDSYKNFNFPEDSLKIICNSIVKNDEFLEYINGPDVLTFADPVFHFGASEYASKFREDVLKVVKKYNTYIVIPESTVPLMLKHYPKLEDYIIGIPNGPSFNFPSYDRFFVKYTANILTLFMLPFASCVVDTIFVLGADGRKENEKYFWRHSSNAQYDSLMESVFKAHPSFFRDRNYEDYYKTHCETLEKLISYGESLGKVYFSITESYIPALKKRWINFNKKDRKEILREIEFKREEIKNKQKKENPDCLNFEFKERLNTLYTYINSLKESKIKVALYGFGAVGRIFYLELKDQVVAIFDDNALEINDPKVFLPEKMGEFSFDKLVICILGPKENVLKKLKISPKKIMIIDISKKAPKILKIDENLYEYKEKNLLGPFHFDCNISIDETKIILEYLNDKKGIMIDVGTHYGSSAKPFLDKGWKVYAYEPDPENRKILEEKLKNNQNLIISDLAISNSPEYNVDFYTSSESSGISSLLPFTNNHKKAFKVKVTTLTDELLKHNIKTVDVLKIDTEGYDLMVLKGFSWDITKPKIIICEFEDKKTTQLGYTVYETIDFLKNFNYNIYISEWYPVVRYGIRHNWKRFFKFETHKINSESWGNILAFLEVPDEFKLKEIIYNQALYNY